MRGDDVVPSTHCRRSRNLGRDYQKKIEPGEGRVTYVRKRPVVYHQTAGQGTDRADAVNGLSEILSRLMGPANVAR